MDMQVNEVVVKQVKKRGGRRPMSNTRKIKSFELIKKIIESRGGDCLSTEYGEKVDVRCKRGHEWTASSAAIRSGRWCRKCYDIDQRFTEFKLIEIGKSVNLELVTSFTYYKGTHQSLEWKCENGHVSKIRPHDIKNRKQGCTQCNSFIGEQICRQIFELIFHGYLFAKIRPEWLVNHETGGVLELDGYCDELKIAFEYQGKFYHSKPVQVRRDQIKRNICKNLGIKLIEVPEFNIPTDGNYKFIISNCVTLINATGIDVQRPLTRFVPKLTSKSYLSEILDFIKQKGGATSLDMYVTSDSRFKVDCGKGHTFNSSRSKLLIYGNWCPKCQINNLKEQSRLKIDDRVIRMNELHAIASKKKGLIRSSEYHYRKIDCECEKGHRWTATPANIRNGWWCGICSDDAPRLKLAALLEQTGGKIISEGYNAQRMLIECCAGHQQTVCPTKISGRVWCIKCRANDALTNLKVAASNLGWVVVSSEYNSEKMTFRCKNNHEKTCHPGDITSKARTCSACSKEHDDAIRKVKGLLEMQEIAKLKNGECLSSEYIDNQTKMQFKCHDENHPAWDGIPANIKIGRWCPECARIQQVITFKKNRLAKLQQVEA